MHDHRIHPYQLHQYDIARKAVLQIFVHHGVAAIFDDNRTTFLNVWQRVGQNLCDVKRLI